MPAIWNNLLHLFFPRLCLLCKEPLTQKEKQLCQGCLHNLPYTCFYETGNNLLFQRLMGKVLVEHATAFLYYVKRGTTQQLVFSLKYYGNKELAYLLGRLMALAFRDTPLCSTADVLIPVPLHRKRERKRGYNQAEKLCRGIASVWDLPVDTTSLYRLLKTDTQTKRGLYDRWFNMQDVFAVKDAEALQDKHVILVDDVVTSGSTACSCAEALLTAVPGIRVSVFALTVVA
ncbi:MAG: ComF family protein [Tannerellaceae bacterium]|jgi:ComF family protein|nr:ComF family protein [Tannerellaceae bacterium]